MYKVDLNSDLGESYGAYTIGMDEAVIAHISSANVACGYHAGDPLVMDNEDLYQARQMIESIIKHIDERLSVHDFRMVRGPGHTNLIFDLVLPHDLDSKQSELKSMIDQELQKQDEQYYAVITFDSEAFN